MTRTRLTLVSLCAITMMGAACASAQSYPSRPIRLVVALAAGGPTDIVMRIYATKMGELLGQQVVVDNRAAAGGAVAGDIVARSVADGHTLFAGANGTIARVGSGCIAV